jgi:adenosylcobinamide kinase / adenosylcobinamide-phosphate guanylyltransferase
VRIVHRSSREDPGALASSQLVLGGARSGKSRFATAAFADRRRVAFVATAQAGDDDMAARIARHRAERPPHWRTVEEPLALPARLAALSREADAVVVDCVTLWIANLLLRGDGDAQILAAADELAALARRPPFDLALVSNEVGAGVVPPTADGVRFRDLLGFVNQRLAAACERVTLMVAGLPLTIKTPGGGHDFARQTA